MPGGCESSQSVTSRRAEATRVTAGNSTRKVDDLVKALRVNSGDSENETVWTDFLRDVNDRGLSGVRWVISDLLDRDEDRLPSISA